MNFTIRNTRPTLLTMACGAVLALGAVSVSTAGPIPMSDQAAMDSQQPVSDTWITTKVKAELATTDKVKSMDVSVDTVNGVVHLTGNVHSDMERSKAIAAAKSVKGVKKVDASGLKASANPAPEGDDDATDSNQPVTDTWITTKVKAELATTDNVDSMDVSVDTVNGVVHLTGNAGSDIERKKAVASARSVKGVKSVDASGLKIGGDSDSMDHDIDHDSDHDMDDESDAGSQQPVTDTWITTKVKAELATTEDASGMHVSVDTVNGVVHLSGNVESDLVRKKSIAAAKSVKGVKKVDASALKSMQ